MAKNGFFKNMYLEAKTELKGELTHFKELKKLERKTFRTEEKKQAIIFARQSALHKRKKRIAELKRVVPKVNRRKTSSIIQDSSWI